MTGAEAKGDHKEVLLIHSNKYRCKNQQTKRLKGTGPDTGPCETLFQTAVHLK